MHAPPPRVSPPPLGSQTHQHKGGGGVTTLRYCRSGFDPPPTALARPPKDNRPRAGLRSDAAAVLHCVFRPLGGGGGANNSQTTPGNNQHNPQYANYWAPLTRKRHIPPHPAQPRHTNHWAPRTQKRHQQEHRLQRPTERSDPTQHAKGRAGDCPGPRKGAATRRNVTREGGGDA